MWQVAKLHERNGANDRVVPPIMPKSLRPEIQPRDEDRFVKPICKLLHAPEQRLRVHQRRHALDEPHLRMHFHHFDQINNRLAAHHAVRVEHDEVAITPAPGAEKIANVPALLALVRNAAAIINPPERVQFADQFAPTLLFFHPLRRIGGIAQDKKVAPLNLSRLLEGRIRRAQSYDHTRVAFVVSRKHLLHAHAFDAQTKKNTQTQKTIGIAIGPQHNSKNSMHHTDG